MNARRPGLWGESAGALLLLLLATLVVATVPLGLVLGRFEAERREEVALVLSEVVCGTLGETRPGEDTVTFRARVRSHLALLQADSPVVDDLAVVGEDGAPLAVAVGQVGGLTDSALWGALVERRQVIEGVGGIFQAGDILVLTPLSAPEPAALLVRVHLASPWDLGLSILGIPAACFLPVLFFYGQVWIRRRVVRPILALRDGTRRIAEGDFGHQLRLDATRELSELADDLNALSRSLRRYRARTRRQVRRLRQTNRDLEAAQAALVRTERLASTGRLAAGLAHEVGNPLAAVLGFQELLAEGLDDAGLRDPALERDLVARSRRELERIHRIIRQLLHYARPGSGQVEEVPVGPALDEALHTVRPQPGARGATLSAAVEDPTLSVRVERDKLHQVLVNLLLNAVDALPAEAAREVRLSARAEAGGVLIGCEDTGAGFSEEALRRAFEPFFSTKAVGKGTGLGLATCLHLVEAAGGWVRAENRAEGGARVQVWLPAGAA